MSLYLQVQRAQMVNVVESTMNSDDPTNLSPLSLLLVFHS